MARPREFDRDEVLDRAIEVFWTRGYDRTSVQDLVDSMGIMRLVNFLEEELSTAVPPTDITVENFLTIGHIARYVDERTGA